MELLFLYAIACIIVGWIGSATTLGFGSAFLLSVILTPIVGFIIILFYPNKKHRDEQLKLLKNVSANTSTEVDRMASLHDQLEKLESMKDKKLITEKEYEFMRKEIMQNKA